MLFPDILRERKKRFRKKKNVLFLEHVDGYAMAHKALLQNNGVSSFILEVNDRLNKEEWADKVANFVDKENIGLIITDTGFHLELKDLLVDVQKRTETQVLYLLYLGKKYVKKEDLQEPNLFIVDINNNPEILVEKVKEMLN